MSYLLPQNTITPGGVYYCQNNLITGEVTDDRRQLTQSIFV